MNNRDMYYNAYGYGEMIPYNFTSPNVQIPIPQLNNNYTTNQLNDMNDRINRL